MSGKKPQKPVWWKNTFFWFAGFLLILGLVGIAGEDRIRDPGQVREGGLVLIYLGGAVLMLINGWLTHRSAVQHFEEGE